MSKAQIETPPDTEAALLTLLAERERLEGELGDTRRRIVGAQTDIDRIMSTSKLTDKTSQTALEEARFITGVGPSRIAALEKQLAETTEKVGKAATAHNGHLCAAVEIIRATRIEKFGSALRPYFTTEEAARSFAIRSFGETVQAQEVARLEAALKTSGPFSDSPPMKKATAVLRVTVPTE